MMPFTHYPTVKLGRNWRVIPAPPCNGELENLVSIFRTLLFVNLPFQDSSITRMRARGGGVCSEKSSLKNSTKVLA